MYALKLLKSTLFPGCQCGSSDTQHSSRNICLQALGRTSKELETMECEKLELKRFLFIWGLLVWQVANHVSYNVFCLLPFGMLRALHALSAWMNGKCWNNCFTLLSGVSGTLNIKLWISVEYDTQCISLLNSMSLLPPLSYTVHISLLRRHAQQWMALR